MDVYNALESRIERLIAAHRQLKQRVVELEAENAAFRTGEADLAALQQRVAALEAEREEVRGRLERLLAALQQLEV
ncbi:MAG: cell division protein ZapB [Acidobacteriota bacterium]|jgi:septal ring factor EnvC (AmiA/AmiB activator)